MKYFQLKSSQLASFQINQFFSYRKLGEKSGNREGVRKGREKELREKEGRKQRRYFKTLMEARNQFQGIDSVCLCSLPVFLNF